MAIVGGGRGRINRPSTALFIATLLIGIATMSAARGQVQYNPRPLLERDRPEAAPVRPPQANKSDEENDYPDRAPVSPPVGRKETRRSSSWLLIGGGVVGGGLVIGVLIVVIRAQPRRKHTGKKVKVTENQVGNYRLVNLVVTGLNSQVWEAAEMVSGRHFALKILLPEHAHSPAQRQFLFHEAEVGKVLQRVP